MPGDVTWRHDVTRRHEGLFSVQTSQPGHRDTFASKNHTADVERDVAE